MAKKGMKRPEITHTEARNSVTPVPEFSGAAKSGKVRASDVFHGHDKVYDTERPLSGAYAVFGSDLARDNLENDLTAADRQDL